MPEFKPFHQTVTEILLEAGQDNQPHLEEMRTTEREKRSALCVVLYMTKKCTVPKKGLQCLKDALLHVAEYYNMQREGEILAAVARAIIAHNLHEEVLNMHGRNIAHLKAYIGLQMVTTGG